MLTESEIHGLARKIWIVWQNCRIRYSASDLFIEEGNYLDVVSLFFEALSKDRLRAVTSTITLLEVLIQPYRRGDKDLAEKYRDILLYSENLLTFPVSNEIADEAAKLRARYGIRTPDAIQISTAIHGEATAFLTNDKNLKKVQEIDIITLFDIK